MSDVLWTVIRIGQQVFALPSSAVLQAMATPVIFPLPFAPAHIVGMAHVDGDVLPCVALDVAFGQSGTSAAQRGESIVLQYDGRRVLILADAVVRHVQLSAEVLQGLRQLDGNEDDLRHAVVGELALEGDSVFLLDAAYLASFSARQRPRDGRPGLADSAVEDAQAEHQDAVEEETFLYITISGQHYAVAVDRVSEIVDLEQVSAVPGAPPVVRGLTLVRGASYLVLSSARWLALPADDPPAFAIMLHTGSGMVLLDVDSVDDVVQVPRSAVRSMHAAEAVIAAVIEHDDGVVRGVVNVDAVGADGLARYIPEQRDRRDESAGEEQESFLMVRWREELFAISLPDVLRLEEDCPVQAVDSEFYGAVCSFDGDTLPVLRPEFFYGMDDNGTAREGYIVLQVEQTRYAVPLQNAERIIAARQRDVQRRTTQGDERFAGTVRYRDALVTLVNMGFFRERIAALPGVGQ